MRILLDENKHELALVVGNGINRHESAPGTNSWEGLLTDLARRHLDPKHKIIPKGVSPTEFYDVLEIATSKTSKSKPLQTQFCDLMSDWRPLPQHFRIVRWAKNWQMPVLTTNFELTLGTASSSKLRRCGGGKFTAYYPWTSCYAPSEIKDPLRNFAIWHINGMQNYRQSIRLGLSHYMGSVERARGWLHKSGNRLFAANDITSWPGANTWLQIFLHKPLLFFGLKLEENEVFLRWLLIERAKYFRKNPIREKQGWYIYTKGSDDLNPGKELFLRGVGIKPYAVPDYSHIYAESTWR